MQPVAPEPATSDERLPIWLVLLCALPVVVVVLSLAWGLHEGGSDPFDGIVFAVLAAVVGVWHFDMMILAPRRFRRRTGSMDDYRSMSGLPGCGSFLVVVSSIVGFGAVGTALVNLAVLAVDLGGVHWFLVVIARECWLRR